MKRKFIIWLPLAVTIAMFATFFVNLMNPSERVIASRIVGQMVPAFEAVAAIEGQAGTKSSEYADGKPRLLNVFASWCGPCVAEVPVLQKLKAMGVEINGVAVHDRSEDLARFLDANGNPYTRVGLDQDGRAQMAFGSAGVPETFVIDGSGRIIHQHIGVVTEEDIPVLLAKLKS